MDNNMYQTLIENSVLAYAYHKIIYDKKGNPCDAVFLTANQAFQQVTALDEKEIVGREAGKILPEIANGIIKALSTERTATNTPHITQAIHLIFRKQEQKLWLQEAGAPYFWLIIETLRPQKPATAGKNLNTLVVNASKPPAKNAKTPAEVFRLITEYISDVIWVFNYTHFEFTYLSPSVFALNGYTPEEVMGKRPQAVVIEEDVHLLRMNMSTRIKNLLKNPHGTHAYVEEFRQPHKNGSVCFTETVMRYRFNDNNEIEIIGITRNINERKKAERQATYLCYYDQLTGFYNRRFYEKELRRLDNPMNYPITLVVADVNGLKMTNDAFGHLMGDRLLIRVAQIMQESCCSNDVIARIGGDEFVLLLPKTSQEGANLVVERIKRKMSEEYMENTIISAAFGCATKTADGQDISTIFVEAENKMYRNKLWESSIIYKQNIQNIIQTLYRKSAKEERHSHAVAALCSQIATVMDLGTTAAEELRTAGLFHDIGKVALDEKLLNKKDLLTDNERKQIRRHCEIGYQILKSSSEFANIAEYVLCQHERIDGKGYPRGLEGNKIPLQAKIISIADAYDNIINDRQSRGKQDAERAIAKIKENAGTQFDPNIVNIFIKEVLKDMHG